MPSQTKQRIPDEQLHSLTIKGIHEAFVELKKRYHKHSLILVNQLLTQYINTGISKKDLLTICEGHFSYVIRHYQKHLASFYSFWKETTLQTAMDYLIENSYGGAASSFYGSISLNQENDGRYQYEDVLSEKDTSKDVKKQVFEVKAVMAKYDAKFTVSEKAVLNLLLSGLTMTEIENTGLYGKTYIYLTFKSASEKLQKYLKDFPKNNK